MNIAKAIVQLRKDEGLTQKSLALMSCISEVFIRHIEAGIKSPSLKTLRKIADAVDRDLTLTYTPKNKITCITFSIPEIPRSKQFDERITALQHRLYTDLLKMTRNSDVALDIQQEAIFRALLYHYRFNENSQLYTWLFAIARNVYTEFLKKSKNIQFVEDYIETAEVNEEIAREVRIRQYIDRLSPKAKQLYKLRLLNYSYSEIAIKLNITASGAKSWFWTIHKQINERHGTYTE